MAVGRVWANDVPDARVLDMSQPQEVYLEVTLNGQPTGQILRFRAVGDALSCAARDLSTIGIDIGKLGVEPSSEVALNGIDGLRYRYDAAEQRVELSVPDRWRRAFAVDARQLPGSSPASSGRGLLLNYDAYLQSDSGTQLALWSELRYFAPSGVLDNTGTFYANDNRRRYVRYETSWSRSDPATLSTLQLGDAITSSLAWSRSVRFAGFQWRSDFALRPDLITFPLPSFSGSAAVPSAVDLYVNNVRRASVEVPSGPFVFNNTAGINGAGQATLVTRDALGRTVTTSLPLYIDTRMMAEGLSSYAVEAGFLRRRYGEVSFDYAPDLAGSASWRRGISDALTLEAHAEATSGLFNGGIGALVRFGQAGVLSGSVAGSGGGRFQGSQASIGYQWIQPRLSIDAELTRSFGDYGDLATRDGAPPPRSLERVTFSLPLAGGQNLALSYIGLQQRGVPTSRIGSLSYLWSAARRLTLNFSAYRDFAHTKSRGVFLSANLSLDHQQTVSALVGSQSGQSYYNLQALRPVDYAGGWGWGVQDGRSGGIGFRQAQLQYLGSAGQLTGLVQSAGGHTVTSVDALGSVVWMDGSLHPARHIYDGFALVSTDGVANVPVFHENRIIGRTDEGGHLLVPDLNAYQNNALAIDSMKLAPDMRVDTTALNAVPQAQSGVLAHFPIARYAAASIALRDAEGKPLPPGTRVHHEESGTDTVVGYDGLTFIGELRAENHLRLDGADWHCAVSFRYQAPTDHGLPLIGPLVCRRQPGSTP
ncbi:fimbria/pilus outer membrane usher protein [Dyella koreensis]|uniref:Fimbrial biogenesis outer membrane usher protein n=1 Tax=Dyella koreensis TaxID=311235 RepID=A0ABW8K4Y7_9GAMM